MFALYNFDNNQLTTFSDIDEFLSQFIIEKENFGGVKPDLIRFIDMPGWMQEIWKPNLETIFSNKKIYGLLDKSIRCEGTCWFSLDNDGKENFFEPRTSNYFYNRFRLRNEAGTDNYLLMVDGFAIYEDSESFVLKRERAELIDSILPEL